MSIAPPGCTSSQPIYDAQGYYIGQREEFDAGKTLCLVGGVMSGVAPLAANVQAASRVAAYGRVVTTVGSAIQHDRNPVVFVSQPSPPTPVYMNVNSANQLDSGNTGQVIFQIQPGVAAPGSTPIVTTRVGTAAPLSVRVNTAIGPSPLLVSFSAELPEGIQPDAQYLWTDNGEPIASGRAIGQKYVTTARDHRIEVLVTLADGRELRAGQTVTVLGGTESRRR